MTKEQALQLIDDSPNAVFKLQTLSDGQREVIILPDGEDPDYYPAQDVAAIEGMTFDDMPDGRVKNAITLRKYKAKLINTRNQRRDTALLKRIKSLVTPAGVSLRKIAKVIQRNLPEEVK